MINLNADVKKTTARHQCENLFDLMQSFSTCALDTVSGVAESCATCCPLWLKICWYLWALGSDCEELKSLFCCLPPPNPDG